MYAVIGDPIGHSMSPLIHNDAFHNLGIEGYYHAFRVSEDSLEQAIEGMKALQFKGFNVTVPHKVDVMKYLDSLDESATLAGAVNTVVNKYGKWVGYNTDGIGFYRSIENRLSKPLEEVKAVIIGAGGASRGIYATLAKRGIGEIDLVNRTIERAITLKEQCPFPISGKIMSLEEFESEQSRYDVVIQTTSIGMSPNVLEQPVSLKGKVDHQSIVADIIYNPLKTAFLKEAERLGAIAINGVGMFVHQAAESFYIWTNEHPDVERMTQIVYEKLKGAT